MDVHIELADGSDRLVTVSGRADMEGRSRPHAQLIVRLVCVCV